MKKKVLLLYLLIAVAFPTTIALVLGLDLALIHTFLEEIKTKLPF